MDPISIVDSIKNDIPYQRRKSNPSAALPRVSFDFGHIENLNILVVDDDPVSVKIAKKCLENSGYSNVFIACCAAEALEALDSPERHYSIVLCDVYMDGMNGIELLQTIRQTHQDLCIIMLSSAEDTPLVYECLEKGADDYIIKPIRPAVVKNLWSNIWRKKRERKILNLLTTEKEESDEKSKQLEDLGIAVKDLENQVHDAVETPINAIIKIITEIMAKNQYLTPDVQDALHSIINTLGSSNIYRPVFTKILGQSVEDNPRIDVLTKRWLFSEIGTVISNEEKPPETVQWKPVSEEVSQLRSWDFTVFSRKEEDLLGLAFTMFTDFDLLVKFQIPEEKLRNFLLAVKAGYNANPYHNFRHAFDVTQSVYLFLTTGKAAELISHLEILGLLIAALSHDIGHPGVNNSFLINTESSLSISYNDVSVLENFHASTLFTILKKEDCAIFANIPIPIRQELRKIIISCILATDPARTMEIHSKFDSLISQYNRDNKEHRHLLATSLIKCADLSNPVRTFKHSQYWAEMIQEEFYNQGDKEKEIGLEVSPFMDRDCPEALPRIQVNFMEFLVQPLFSSLAELLPSTSVCINNLLSNKQTWLNYLSQSSDLDV